MISFGYSQSLANQRNLIHDPRPMVIVTDVWAPNYIRGLNLHYLTLPYIKNLLQTWSGNPNFNYYSIKGDKFLAGAFRMYVMRGIQNPKRLDSEWLMAVLQSVRTFDTGELEKIKASIRQQIQTRLQVQASQLANQPAPGFVQQNTQQPPQGGGLM